VGVLLSQVASATAGVYERHRPEASLLYKLVQRHWRTFEAQIDAEHDGHGLPSFVRQEFETYLRCGILACRSPGTWGQGSTFSPWGWGQ
jgi:hypothetical protein